jgi:TonB family protein
VGLLVFVLLVLSSAIQGPETPILVPENGVKATSADGVLDLEGGRGWLRTEQVFLDFQMSLEFRALTAETDAAVLIRTWVARDHWPERGFRIALPSRGRSGNAALLIGRRETVTVVRQDPIALRPLDEWQDLRIEARGKRIRLTLNGLPAGEFEIDRFGGHVMLENRKGHVQIRNLTLRAAEPLSSAFAASSVQRPTGWAVQSPAVVEEVRPVYTPEATRRRIEGIVGLEAVVLPDGSVGTVSVTHPLDPALDASAMAALKGWRFKPGTRGGVPVPILVSVEMTFKLR